MTLAFTAFREVEVGQPSILTLILTISSNGGYNVSHFTRYNINSPTGFALLTGHHNGAL